MSDKFELKSEPATTQPSLPIPPGEGIRSTRTERRKKDSARLVWDSKPKRPPSPRDIEFQTAEIVIPNPARDAGALPFASTSGDGFARDIDRSEMNRLIWGDNLLAMQALLAQGYEGKIDLIYIDPPFDSKADYSQKLNIAGTEVVKEPSIIERQAYTDTWIGGTDSFLDMMFPRLQLMRRLLKDGGAIFVHTDWHAGHYLKVILDEVFGKRALVNEIVWWYYNKMQGNIDHFPSNHDTIYFYSKGKLLHFEPQFEERDKPVKQLKRVWDSKKGAIINAKGEDGKVVYIESTHRRIDSVWRLSMLQPADRTENCFFDTQKPEALLERIIRSSCAEGSLVADFFSGSGTTGAVAEKLGRRWIMSDLGKVGIQVTRGRLVQQDSKPFLIENIGNYQREMIYLTGGRIGEMQRIILKLYGATLHPNFKDLGSRKADDRVVELVYVGYPDRPTTAKKVEELARSAETLDGNGYKRLIVLAWDYDYNYDEAWDTRLKASKKPIKVDVQKRLIPPDVYDYLRKAKDESDIEKLADKIQFHEKPYLKLAKPKVGAKSDGKREVTVGVERYVLFDLPVPEKDREKLRELVKENFAVLIDYWAIDWNYDGTTFKSQWQAIRGNGKKAKVVPTTLTEKLEAGKAYTVAVRVVDVFGNDAAGTVIIET